VVAKLVRRHPHVFGDVVTEDLDEISANWEAIKRTERGETDTEIHPLDRLNHAAPSLSYATDITRIGAKADVAVAPVESGTSAAEQLGRALLVLVDEARANGIDAEAALRIAATRQATLIRRAGR
jgi:XTP/dITP diphosphohydrolase